MAARAVALQVERRTVFRRGMKDVDDVEARLPDPLLHPGRDQPFDPGGEAHRSRYCSIEERNVLTSIGLEM